MSRAEHRVGGFDYGFGHRRTTEFTSPRVSRWASNLVWRQTQAPTTYPSVPNLASRQVRPSTGEPFRLELGL